MEPEIKVTHIKNRYHIRLLCDGKIIDEMACDAKQDIGVVCKELMRWYDKTHGDSLYAEKARLRESTVRDNFGKIWYWNELEAEKNKRKNNA